MKRILVATLAIAALPALSPAASAQDATLTGSVHARAGAEVVFEVAQIRTYLDVLAQLEADSYIVDEVRRSLLGRVMISAHNRIHARQIVVSSSTGEIMQDVIVEVFADSQAGGSSDPEIVPAEAEDDTGSDGITLGGDLSVDAGVSVGGGGVSVGASIGASGGGSASGGSSSGGGSGGINIGVGLGK